MSGPAAEADRGGQRGAPLLAIGAIIALVWLLVARMLGPSDLWDNSQHKTISYTTDMIVHGGGHWVLPMERGVLYATKPPLYNWIAAPFVMLLGFNSEIAHKLPSVIALCGCWLLLVRLGRELGDSRLGWLAGIALCANAAIFKLGYLARPDMLLTLWITLAWAAATARFARETSKRPNVQTSKGLSDSCGSGATGDVAAQEVSIASARRVYEPHQALDVWTFGRFDVSSFWTFRGLDVFVFWLSIALAGLTKGPPALVGVLAALVSAKVVTGSWRGFAALRPVIGLSACVLIVGLWVYGVWRLQPRHLWEGLWFNEIAGRVTGLGPEGAGEGPIALVSDLPQPFLYYIARFAPWSLCAIAGGIAVWRMTRKSDFGFWILDFGTARGWDDRSYSRPIQNPKPKIQNRALPWLLSAAVWAATALVIFTFSAGKRADYIAIVVPSSSLLAAWWLLRFDRMRIPSPPPLPLWGRAREGARGLTTSSGTTFTPPPLPAPGPPRAAWEGVRTGRGRTSLACPWACFAAALVLSILTWRNQHEPTAPVRGFGDATMRFVNEATTAMADESPPLPLAFWWADDNHLQALLGASQPDGRDAVMDLVRDGQALWVVAGRRRHEPFTFDAWLAQRPRARRGGEGRGNGGSDSESAWRAEPIVQTPLMPRTDHWPEQVTLYRVTPR